MNGDYLTVGNFLNIVNHDLSHLFLIYGSQIDNLALWCCNLLYDIHPTSYMEGISPMHSSLPLHYHLVGLHSSFTAYIYNKLCSWISTVPNMPSCQHEQNRPKVVVASTAAGLHQVFFDKLNMEIRIVDIL